MSFKDSDYGCLGVWIKGKYPVTLKDGTAIPRVELNCYSPSDVESRTIKVIKCITETPDECDCEKDEIYNCYKENDKHYFYFNEYGAKCFALKEWFAVVS